MTTAEDYRRNTLSGGHKFKESNAVHNKHFLVSDLNLNVTFKISYLQGNLELLFSPKKHLLYGPPSRTNPSSSPMNMDFYATVKLMSDGRLLCAPVHTDFGKYDSINQYNWNRVIQFPIKYQSLPLSSHIVITIWDIIEPGVKVPCGGTSISIFNSKGILRVGEQKLHVWEGQEGDPNKTFGKIKYENKLEKIEKAINKYQKEKFDKIEWLDRLASRAIEKINAMTDQSSLYNVSLFIELPEFEYPVQYYQKPNPNAKSVVNIREKNEIVIEYDPCTENPVEQKYIIQSRARNRLTFYGIDKDLKPNTVEMKILKKIISYPLTKRLNEKENELIWKYRYYLQNNKKALTKFVSCVDWKQPQQEKEGIQLLEGWEPIDIDSCLELLSHYFSRLPRIRGFAVEKLRRFSDDEILRFLLQFVQALRYDKNSLQSDLKNFLFERSMKNEQIAHFLYWYLCVESDEPNPDEYYKKLLNEFLNELQSKNLNRKDLDRQKEWISLCYEMSLVLKKSGLSRQKKIEKARKMIREDPKFSVLLNVDPMPIPLYPNSSFNGIDPDVYIFNSALSPLKLDLINSKSKDTFSIMLKMGDDLRQDQMVVQLISLMDDLLKRENLDLKLTSYRVLATKRDAGILELVPRSMNIADVLKKYDKDIKKYMKAHNPDPSSTESYGIAPYALSNFVRSCAGYCVITYILGVGDRHLDNLLLTEDGKLFHIDFGFILGRDPKPFPPMMKICKEMVEGMGGKDSPHYHQFKSYACEAYNIIRKSSNLILNLISLMIDAGLKDVDQGEQSVLKVQEKLKLDMTDEEASQHITALINESERALFPPLVETVHRWAKYWRN